ncbi:MAG: hypothetical protein OXH96_10510 [Spirochaetaceae bacterium]|nr:hypothetical protein [Spirochaetaceae bacterium]
MRLCIALGDFDAARETGATLNAVAAERGLVRTRMRGLALAMALEHRAGNGERARAHLAEFLRLFSEADYAWPLARERTVFPCVARRGSGKLSGCPRLGAGSHRPAGGHG